MCCNKTRRCLSSKGSRVGHNLESHIHRSVFECGPSWSTGMGDHCMKLPCIFVVQHRFPDLFLFCHHLKILNQSTNQTLLLAVTLALLSVHESLIFLCILDQAVAKVIVASVTSESLMFWCISRIKQQSKAVGASVTPEPLRLWCIWDQGDSYVGHSRIPHVLLYFGLNSSQGDSCLALSNIPHVLMYLGSNSSQKR